MKLDELIGHLYSYMDQYDGQADVAAIDLNYPLAMQVVGLSGEADADGASNATVWLHIEEA